jgi:hypothetical protein
MKQILDEIDAVETTKAQTTPGPTTQDKIDDETANGGLLTQDGNIGVLGVIKDEDSCQDSDFSGDEPQAEVDKNAPTDKPVQHKPIKQAQSEKIVDKMAALKEAPSSKKDDAKAKDKKVADPQKVLLKVKKKPTKNPGTN